MMAGTPGPAGLRLPPGPGIWQPTPPGFLPPATPWIRSATPWTMTSPSQFRVPPPPALDSDTWVHDYDETKAYGGAISSVRTADQTDLARVRRRPRRPPHAAVARYLARHCKRSEAFGPRCGSSVRNAVDGRVRRSHRLLGFEVRSTRFWRPVTAIRAGGGNPDLTADPTWIGLVITPNHPEYPAAHGCFSGSVVEVLTSLFRHRPAPFHHEQRGAGLTPAGPILRPFQPGAHRYP